MFRYQIPFFSPRYRILTFDWRGQGKSEATPEGYDIESLYEDAVELLERLNTGPVHWVGVSMGGFAGLRLAARRPDLIRSLIAVGTSDEAEKWHKKLKWGLLAWIFRLAGAGPVIPGIEKALFGRTRLSDPAFRPILDEYEAKWKRLPKEPTFRTAWAIFNRKAVTPELLRIQAPVLVATGEEDASRPLEEARRMTARIPGARMEVIPKAGHSSPLEQPEYFNDMLMRFLQTVPRQS
ncbi:MAG: alpha/beta fold hydrolase [Chlorobi bacterium]|nr:alpha/beta fold hydrolase [Chlorobiota bacterium]